MDWENGLPAIRSQTDPRACGFGARASTVNGDYSITPCAAPALPVNGSPAPPRCAFTIDVEDWYQSSVDFDAPISDRVLRNVGRACAVLDEHRLKGTFFVQGRVAETFPRLLQELLAAGHEIQSHGYSHRPLFSMDRRALRTELEYARKTVEDACGVRVTSFRAPDFSIVRRNLWALDVLAEVGFEIDSSIFPMSMGRYGIAGWEIGPHRVALPGGKEILEVPVAIVQSEHDEFIKREHAEYLARSIPGAEFVLLPGVSHFAPLQRPAEFNRAYQERVCDYLCELAADLF